MSRRRVLQAGTAASVGVGAITLSACASGPDTDGPHLRGAVSTSDDPGNPFGVDGSVPLDVTVFKGGYSDEYATEGHERLYSEKFPDAKIIHLGTEQISEAVGPRFGSYRPPDVLLNGGGERLELDRLVAQGNLTDLRILLDAPSIDNPEVTVAETMRASSVAAGKIGGEEVWGLPYDFAGYGLWYSQKLFDVNGWQKPRSWPDFMDLCGQIKRLGLAPFTFQGLYPYYMVDPIITLAVRHGGIDVYDRLYEDFNAAAWQDESIHLAVSAWEEFVSAGYVLEGSRDLTHRQAQRKWIDGEAVFIPCGSWLENEESQFLTNDFDLAFMPVPPLPGSSAANLVQGSPGEHFVVPRFAKNPAGGLEYLRIMLSSAGSDAWVAHTASLNALAGATVETDRPGVTALKEYLSVDDDLYTNSLEAHHGTFADVTLYPAITKLMLGDLSAEGFVKRLAAGV